jgi:hypothetical protein
MRIKVSNTEFILTFTSKLYHFNPHSHNCTFDPKKDKQKEIIQNNPKLSSKLVKI